MDWSIVFKLLHVLSAFWFTAGLIGRWFTQSRSAAAADIRTVKDLGQLSGFFENRMVIPGSMVVLGLGLLTAWAEGAPLLGFFEGSRVNWLLASILLYLSLIPIIPLIFLPRGKVFARALDEASARGQVTPALTAAFRDPVVRVAHIYELVAVGAIIILMVTKPF